VLTALLFVLLILFDPLRADPSPDDEISRAAAAAAGPLAVLRHLCRTVPDPGLYQVCGAVDSIEQVLAAIP
jgi:hypothetical protein